jgi:uncharacterized protein (UPF0218 family)
VLSLPAPLRAELAEPFGPVYEDATALLADAGRPVVAVGDVVAYHLREAGHEPAVSVVDGRTERRAAPDPVRRAIPDPDRTVENPAGRLSRALLIALRDAVAGLDPDPDRPVVVRVEGEEDLATLPAILLAPPGGAVVYGQPGAGMVLVVADASARDRTRDLLGRMDGDNEAALALLDAADPTERS